MDAWTGTWIGIGRTFVRATIIPVLAGRELVASAALSRSLARSDRVWATTWGKTMSVRIRWRRHGRGPYREFTYGVHVTYEYRVDGVRYEGRWFDFGLGALVVVGREEADRAAARYAAGTRVAVCYDPADPATAVLERRGSTTEMAIRQAGGLFLIGCTVSIVLVGLLMLAVVVRS